jgi:hypothetical protein
MDQIKIDCVIYRFAERGQPLRSVYGPNAVNDRESYLCAVGGYLSVLIVGRGFSPFLAFKPKLSALPVNESDDSPMSVSVGFFRVPNLEEGRPFARHTPNIEAEEKE